MSKVKMIKNDAVINVSIGTGFLQRLQKLMFFIAVDITEEQLKEYKELAEKKEPFTEDWMDHLATISILIKEIEQKAQEQGYIYEKDIDEVATQQDNLPVPPVE